MAEHTPVRDAPWKKRIDPRKVRGTYPFQRGTPNLQQRSWARCDEDYSCRYKTSCQNQLPQLQGGHVSHKTFSKSTPPVCPSQIQEIKIQLQVGQREPPISVHSIPGCTMCSRKQQYQNQNEKKSHNVHENKSQNQQQVQSSCSSCRQRRRSCSSCYTSPLPSSQTSLGKGR